VLEKVLGELVEGDDLDADEAVAAGRSILNANAAKLYGFGESAG
jgi:hypothetical protein